MLGYQGVPQFQATTQGLVYGALPGQAGMAYIPQFPQMQPGAVASPVPGSKMQNTIWLGNIPEGTTPRDLLNLVTTGAIESVKIPPGKKFAFVSFVDPRAAQAFYQQCLLAKPVIRDTPLEFNWAKGANIKDHIRDAIRLGATRVVYLGALPETMTEDKLKTQVSIYGEIDRVDFVAKKRIAFVHYTSIQAAMNCVKGLAENPEWLSQRINYSTDPCDGWSKYEKMAANTNYIAGAMDPTNAGNGNGSLDQQHQQQYTLYLGNVPSGVMTTDICNSVRGGNLYEIRRLPEKNACFLTFMDPESASRVFAYYQKHDLIVRSNKIRVAWGTKSSVPSNITLARQVGATRNVYIGGYEGDVDEEKIHKDFGEFGEIELVNQLKEKKCVFVNFTSVKAAMKAVSMIRTHKDYKNFRISYGKDRCGNAPRASSRNNDGNAEEQPAANSKD